MEFARVKGITIPNGNAVEMLRNGIKLWSKSARYLPAYSANYTLSLDNLVGFNRADAIKLNANFTNGAVAQNDNRWAMFIPVVGGQTYSFLTDNDAKTQGWYLCQIEADTVEIGTSYKIDGNSTLVNNKGLNTYTLTTNAKAKWVGINVSLTQAQAQTWFDNGIIMVGGSVVPPIITPYGYKYKFAKDTADNSFGYYNKATNEYVKAFGATGTIIQPVASVTNGASSNFDTDVKSQDNLEMLIRFKAIRGSFYILQARQTESESIYGISGSQTGNTITAFGVTSSIIRTEGHIYTVKLTVINRAVTLYVKDETTGTEDTKTGTASASDYQFPSPTTIKLFGDASKIAKGLTVYDAHIKINNSYTWQPIPVRIGTTIEMLDLVNWKFAEKTGSFTYGEDVPWEW